MDDVKRFTLRMDVSLFKSIAMLAKKNRRSVAKERECAIDRYVKANVVGKENDNVAR